MRMQMTSHLRIQHLTKKNIMIFTPLGVTWVIIQTNVISMNTEQTLLTQLTKPGLMQRRHRQKQNGFAWRQQKQNGFAWRQQKQNGLAWRQQKQNGFAWRQKQNGFAWRQKQNGFAWRQHKHKQKQKQNGFA